MPAKSLHSATDPIEREASSPQGERLQLVRWVDEKWSDLQPSILTILAGLDHGFTT